MAKKPVKKPKVSLIVSDDKNVRLKAKVGARYQVVQVDAMTPDLKKAGRIGARLCGLGTNMCIAIVDVEK